MQNLLKLRVRSLAIAATRIDGQEFAKFGELRRLYSLPGTRPAFERLFKTYYGLNSAGLSEKQKAKLLEFVYAPWNIDTPLDYKERFIEIVSTLHEMVNLRGKNTIQASFATKILSFKNDAFPIFDRHVSNFFGIVMPRDIPLHLRLQVFCENIMAIKNQYESLARLEEIATLLAQLEQYPGTAGYSAIRILDFLVFTAGSKKLYDEL